MQVLDSHIALNIAIQKMDSNIFDNLKDEELDWALNWAQDNFIRNYFNSLSNRMRQGFEDNQLVTDYLQSLIRTYKAKPVVQSESHCAFALPTDYLFHDTTELNIYANKCNRIETTKEAASATLKYLPFNTTLAYNQDGVSDFTGFDIKYSGGGSVLPAEIADRLSQYSFPNDRDNLARDIAAAMNGVYWESYLDIRKDGHFIVDNRDLEITMGGELYTTTQQNPYNYEVFYKELLQGGQAHWQEARVVETKDLLASRQHSFKQTRWRSPLCCLREDQFEVYYDGFAPLDATMFYIGKPLRVSYGLGQDLQVPDSAYNLVIQNAANYILHLFQSKLYKSGENEANQIL